MFHSPLFQIGDFVLVVQPARPADIERVEKSFHGFRVTVRRFNDHETITFSHTFLSYMINN